VPRHCPTCGTATLTRTLSTFNGLECGAIKALRVERLLAQLLYEHWAATCTPNNRSTPGTLTTCGRSWLELENNMEYTIVEGDYNELNLRWIVMSNGNGAVWGAFATTDRRYGCTCWRHAPWNC
jgi:hypothetical protein